MSSLLTVFVWSLIPLSLLAISSFGGGFAAAETGNSSDMPLNRG